MISLKLKKRDPSKGIPVAAEDIDQYPYGLQLQLEDEQLKALGIELPKVGKEMIVVGVGTVTSASERDSARGGKHRSCTIQLEQLEIGLSDNAEPKDMVSAISAGVKDANG